MSTTRTTIDGNEAAAHIGYLTNEVIAIYPLTQASPMGELSDKWAFDQHKNIWGTVPRVIEMQSEGGAAGTIHGALQNGALATTFTASLGEADSFLPFDSRYQHGLDQYLEQLSELKKSLHIPIIASLNGISLDGYSPSQGGSRLIINACIHFFLLEHEWTISKWKP